MGPRRSFDSIPWLATILRPDLSETSPAKDPAYVLRIPGVDLFQCHHASRSGTFRKIRMVAGSRVAGTHETRRMEKKDATAAGAI